MATYMKLFHGRNTPDEDLDDWGADGPIIGPLQWVHTTYGATIRLAFVDNGTEADCVGTGDAA